MLCLAQSVLMLLWLVLFLHFWCIVFNLIFVICELNLVNEILLLFLTRMMFPHDTRILVFANQELDWNMTMVVVLHNMEMLMVIG